MNFFKNLILTATILPSILFAQTLKNNAKDTVKYFEKTNRPESINRLWERDNFLLRTKLGLKSFGNYKRFDNFNLNFFDSRKNFQIIRSKKELYRILALKYKERNKYDLGKLGTYLGLSEDAFAIILAIISVIK